MPEGWTGPDIEPRGEPTRPSRIARGACGLALGAILLAGILARWALSQRDGHLFDVDLFLKWMRGLTAHGLGGFFDQEPGCNYPPLPLLTLLGLGRLLSLLDPGLTHAEWARAWLRLPACLADVLIACLLYVEARRRLGRGAGLGAAALYFLNPVSLYNSAYWGQVDSVHSFFVLAALSALNRSRPLCAGAAIGLALLQKFQAVAFLPLVALDIYRWRRWRGLAFGMIGAAAAAAAVLSPFAAAGVLPQVIERGYVRVVGQYEKLSVKAFNLWQLEGIPDAPDSGVPPWMVRIAARGEVTVSEGDHWLLSVTYRRLGLLLFGLALASILALHTRRQGVMDRSLAAGLSGLAFFLFLTEMHERYAFTALAVLPLWAVGGPWRERAYVLLTAGMLLNLTVPQPAEEIAAELGALHLAIFAGLGLVVMLPGLARRVGAALEAPDPAPTAVPDPPAPADSELLVWFRRMTVGSWIAFLCLIAYGAVRAGAAVLPPDPAITYLSELVPLSKFQGYGRLAHDRSLEGATLRLGDQYFLKGLGTHAPCRIEYAVPGGFTEFAALVGVHRDFAGLASIEVHIDGKRAFTAGPLTAADPPVEVRIPLGGATRLTLVAQSHGTRKGDHVDWALARLERSR